MKVMRRVLFLAVAVIMALPSCKPKEKEQDEELMLAGVGFSNGTTDTSMIYKYNNNSNYSNALDSAIVFTRPKGADTVYFQITDNALAITKGYDYKLVVPGAGSYRITGINVSGSAALHDKTMNTVYYGIVSCIIN